MFRSPVVAELDASVASSSIPPMQSRHNSRQIVARYSATKVLGWVCLVAVVSVWLLADGVARGWAIPETRYGWLFPAAMAGAVLGLVTSLALLGNFALRRGVAIAKIDDAFVLYFPFSHKRVALKSGLSISATNYRPGVPDFAGSGFKATPAVIRQVTFHRPGEADVNFRSELLTEDAAIIADRMSAMIQRTE